MDEGKSVNGKGRVCDRRTKSWQIWLTLCETKCLCTLAEVNEREIPLLGSIAAKCEDPILSLTSDASQDFFPGWKDAIDDCPTYSKYYLLAGIQGERQLPTTNHPLYVQWLATSSSCFQGV